MKKLMTWLPAIAGGVLGMAACYGQVKVLVDQVGYERLAPKVAIVYGAPDDHPLTFALLDADSDKSVVRGELTPAGEVRNWAGRVFWTIDFSAWQHAGRYRLQVCNSDAVFLSSIFAIADDVLERDTLSNVVYYFKGQRASGAMDRADSHLKLPDGSGTVDLHGGWYDATGDYGIHFSHQNPTSYFNPQQVPLVAWSLLKSYLALEARKDDNFTEYERRLLDEGLFGADFLARMHRPGGSFFESIGAPGSRKLAKDRAIQNPNWRTEIKLHADDGGHGGQRPQAPGGHGYEVSFRSGGGVAIAALALATRMPEDGELTRQQYLRAAVEAFDFLNAHNAELTNDGVENILDDYCALLAATELYQATSNKRYLEAADRRAAQLMARLTSTGAWHDYWRADAATRPFFHPSDAGLPVYSLIEYARIAAPDRRSQALDAVRRSLHFELAVTAEVNNPFGLARQLVLSHGKPRTAFFFPHDTEAAPWWQGEDARLASLAAAARLAAALFDDDPAFQKQLTAYAWNQLHWILGRNPFDTSMLVGSGHGDAAYMFFKSYKYTNAPGAIVNGITSDAADEDGIAFNQGYAVTGKDEDWRWTEEWLPHAAWYLLAVSLPHS